MNFRQAEQKNGTSVEAAANSVQAEQYARTGISMALEKMGSDLTKKSFLSESVSMTGGTITYQATSVSATQSKIISTAVFNGRTITVTAVFSFNRGRWRMIRSYSTPTPEQVG